MNSRRTGTAACWDALGIGLGPYAPIILSRSSSHNPYAHASSPRDLGSTSSRTRFVELFLITDSVGSLRYPGTCNGIYVLEEREGSPHRVDVDKLEPSTPGCPRSRAAT